MSLNKQVTLKQIAEIAQVSRGTVDKALYNRPGIKNNTRERILKIAEELNYQPNIIGKALASMNSPTKIGVILTPDYNPFVREVLSGIHDAIKEFAPFGFEVIIKMPITLDPVEQIAIINELVSMDISGLAIFPLDNKNVIDRLNALAANGIAICTFNSKLESINDICFVGQNHCKGGKVSAGLFRKLLPDGGKVGIIISSDYLSCHRDRLNGFQQHVADYCPKIEIVEIKENQDRKENAFIITMGYCNKYPDLKGIYITGGGVGGVGSSLKIAKPKQPVHVVCHDLIPDTIELLKDGTVDFAIDQNGNRQGYQIIKILFDYLIKKIPPKDKYFDIPINIATRESLNI